MEISRKKISTNELIAKEGELLEKIKAVKERYDTPFAEYGCEICAEYLKNGEYDDEYSEIDFDESNYVNGYVSRANFTIKRKLTGDEPAITVDDDYENDDERAIALGSLRAKAELERTVAYTEIMIIRIYKTFWKETVSICDNVETLEGDLDEFLEKLKDMQKDD